MLHKLSLRFLHIGQKVPGMKIIVVSKASSEYKVDNSVDSTSFFANKKVVLVGYPGAFTPTCTGNHLPQYNALYEQFKSKGVEVVGLAVNDFFVMKKFSEELKVPFPMICDGSGYFTKAIDGGVDFSEKGMGFRTRRFAVVVDNGVVTAVNDEKGGAMTDLSKAETLLKMV
jgi:peroxiredoxin